MTQPREGEPGFDIAQEQAFQLCVAALLVGASAERPTQGPGIAIGIAQLSDHVRQGHRLPNRVQLLSKRGQRRALNDDVGRGRLAQRSRGLHDVWLEGMMVGTIQQQRESGLIARGEEQPHLAPAVDGGLAGRRQCAAVLVAIGREMMRHDRRAIGR
jgi:hypothetical protein